METTEGQQVTGNMEEISLLTHFFSLCFLFRHSNYSNELISFHARALNELSIMDIKE